jgi:hypothetical protein
LSHRVIGSPFLLQRRHIEYRSMTTEKCIIFLDFHFISLQYVQNDTK